MVDSDDTLLRKPIIIIGAPRSGTTMLTRIFGQHPGLALLIEPRLTWRHGNHGKSDMLQPQDARPEVCRYIRRQFARTVRTKGGQRLVEKHPSNSLRMGFVDRIFPDCKFIHTIRDGRDAVLGMRDMWQNKSRGLRPDQVRHRIREVRLRQVPYYAKEFIHRLLPRRAARANLWGPRIPGIEHMRRELDILDICCLQWRMCVELACQYGRNLTPDRYMEYRIEEFTPAVLERIIKFCELDHCPQMMEFFRADFDPEKPGARSRAADPADLDHIQRWIEPTRRWLRYE